MKLAAFLFLILSAFSAFAQDEVLFQGEFRALTQSIKVKGSTEIHRTATGTDIVSLHGFNLRGGVVLDLKVCGEIFENERACLSICEPRLKEQSCDIPVAFKRYEKVVIFDLDLIQNLAEAHGN